MIFNEIIKSQMKTVILFLVMVVEVCLFVYTLKPGFKSLYRPKYAGLMVYGNNR